MLPPFFSPCSSLERHHKQSLGHHTNDSGLSASVYNQTSSVKISDNVLNIQSFGRTSLVRGNQNPFGERSHTGIKVGGSRDRVLLPLLFLAKENWHFSTHIGPQRSEHIFKTSMFLDVNYSKSETSCTSGGLVCMHRPERCLLPDSNLGGTQAFSSFRWQGVSVPRLTLWPVSCSPHLHAVHGHSTSSCPTSRCENTELFG